LISTIISLLIIVLVFISLFLFFSWQVANITADLNASINSLNEIFNQFQQWTSHHFDIKPKEQMSYLERSLNLFLKNSTSFFTGAFFATTEFFSSFLLFVISLFFFLYYRSFLVSFLFLTLSKKKHSSLKKILRNTQHVVKKYTFGLFLVILIIAFLNISGLLILGINHAVFFGSLVAILAIIPYIGVSIGSIIPIIYVFSTTHSISYPIGVLLIFLSVQFIEGNFITPNIVGNQVSINAFASILALAVGGMMFGILGIILAIPTLAIMKVICEQIPYLKPLNYLLGNPEAIK
jgi:predicted PurR-regulated permease PerM